MISALAAIGDAVLDIDHAGEGADGLDHDVRVCIAAGDDLHELDPQEGDLRMKSLNVHGLPEGLLLLRCQGNGVEAVGAGVPVAGLAASFAARCFFLYWVLGTHGKRIAETGGMGKERMAGRATPLLSVSPLVPTAYIQNLYDPFSLANVKQDTVVSDTEAVAG